MESKPHYHISSETKIDPDDAGEIRRWSDELGVPEEQVREAIRQAGPKFCDVEHALSKRFSEEHEERDVTPVEDIPGRSVPAEEGGRVDEPGKSA
jgi:hypothetical protein